MEVTPNTKKSSEREQDLAKKSKHKRKKDFLNSSVMELAFQLRQTKGPYSTQWYSTERAETRETTPPMKQRPENKARRRQIKQINIE
jgi:hypothetical protein